MNLEIIKRAAEERPGWYRGQPGWSPEAWAAAQHPQVANQADVPEKYRGLAAQGLSVPTKDNQLPEKELTPEQQFQRQLSAAEKEGYEAGQGQWKFWRKQPEWLTEPTSNDPVEYAMQRARLFGFSRAQREDVHNLTGFEAAYTHYLPNWAVKLWNTQSVPWPSGQYKANASSYASAPGKTDIAAEYADQEKAMMGGDPDSEQNMAILANHTGWIGKTPILAALSDSKFYDDVQFADEQNGKPFEYNPSTVSKIYEGIAGIEDAAGKAVVEDSTINALTFGIGGKILGGTRVAGVASKPMVAKAVQFLQKAPKAQKALKFVGQSAAMAGPHIVEQAADATTAMTGGDETARLITGTAPAQMKEDQYRATYGNDAMKAIEDSYYAPNIPEGAEIKSLDDMTQYYDGYTKWRKANNIPDEAMNDEGNKLAYLNWAINAGTPATSVFDTSMFKTLEPEHQVEILDNWLPKRVIRQFGTTGTVASAWNNFSLTRLFTPGEKAFDRAGMLNEAILGDTTGVIKDGIRNFVANASVPAIMHLIESHSGTGSGGSSSHDALLTTFVDACQDAMKEDKTKIAPMLTGIIKFQAAVSNSDSKDPKQASKGVELMRTAFKDVLADPDSFEGMPDKDKLEIIRTLAKVYSSKDGPAMLGQEGDELAAKIMSNLQTQALELAKTHPEMWPDLMGAYLMSKGMPEMGEAVSNPWVFWTGAGALLLGGAAVVSSVLDDDDDEDEDDTEDDEANAYADSIRRATARMTNGV